MSGSSSTTRMRCLRLGSALSPDAAPLGLLSAMRVFLAAPVVDARPVPALAVALLVREARDLARLAGLRLRRLVVHRDGDREGRPGAGLALDGDAAAVGR